ncbi:MAG: HAMP domain-containing sensor histidine kinase [Longimicrobiales bacterium]
MKASRAGRSGAGRGRWRRGLPIAFLGLSLTVAGFGALEAYRAEQSYRAAAAGVMTDYADFAARSFEQRTTELLSVRFNRTFSAVRGNPVFAQGHATQQCLALLLAPTGPDQCDCAPVRLAGAWSFFHRFGGSPPEGQWGGDAPDDPVRALVVETVRSHARERYESGWGYALVQVEDGPLVAYTRLVSSTSLDNGLVPSADTLLYGVEVDDAQVAALYRWVLDEDPLLPGSLVADRPNAQVVQVDVLDDFGQTLFASHPGSEHLYPAEVAGRAVLGGGAVRASIVPSMADELIIGGLPSDRTPILLLIFVLAAALAAAAVVQLRRENHLARLRQDFVASVSHELRTPLAQVRLFTETLRLGRTRTEGERSWALESIDRETVRLSHLVENILHFSRSERGVQATERALTDLADEVREAVEAFRPLLPESRGRLECEVAPGLVAEVHPDSIRQVLLNYLDNAVRYGARGQTIRVRGERHDGMVRLLVDDQGPGVPPGERERIFEPFHRGNGPVGTSVAGSGIGLSVVREIALCHGGEARVEDAPGGGARFVLEIPAADTAHPRHFDRRRGADHPRERRPAGTGAA